MFKNELELIENRQYAQLRHILKEMNPADLAQLFEEVPEESLPIVFRILPKELAAETFVMMEPDEQQILIRSFSDTELKEVLDEMYMDDTVDVIEEMPAGVVKRILKNTDAQTRRTINAILQYPEDSAGSIMTTEFMDLKADMTVADAFLRIRRTGFDKETIYTCYVTDSNRKLLGLVTVLTLLLSETDRLIGDIMEKNVISVETQDDQEQVAMKFDKYDLLAMPVVDTENRLVGIVTVDDAIDVMQEEVQEDFEKMAAIHPTEDSYFRTPVWKHARNRIGWLLLLMLSATFTGMLLTHYENAVAAIPLLVSFIPMLMDTSGNCGSQSSTVIIRGLAVGEMQPADVFRVCWKELRIALLVGVTMAAVNFVRVYIMYHDVTMGFVTGITMIGVCCVAKSLGTLLPMAAKKLKLDPAVMASPIITTIADCLTVMLYFAVAVRFFNISM